VCIRLYYLGLYKYTLTFTQWWNRLTARFSERIPVVKRHMTVDQEATVILLCIHITVQQCISLLLTSMNMHQHFWIHLMYVKWMKAACMKKLCVWRPQIETAHPSMEMCVNMKFWPMTSLLQLIMKVWNTCYLYGKLYNYTDKWDLSQNVVHVNLWFHHSYTAWTLLLICKFSSIFVTL